MKTSRPNGVAIESLIVRAGACSPSKPPSRSVLQIVSAMVDESLNTVTVTKTKTLVLQIIWVFCRKGLRTFNNYLIGMEVSSFTVFNQKVLKREI